MMNKKFVSIICHFSCIVLSGIFLYLLVDLREYLEDTKHFFTFYWVFSIAMFIGGIHYVIYLFYRIWEECLNRDVYYLSDRQSNENDTLRIQFSSRGQCNISCRR